MLELDLEQKMAETMGALEALAGYQIVRAHAGQTREDADYTGTVEVAVDMRQHDSFSLPTLNVTGTVTVATLGERDSDGSIHNAALAAVVEALQHYHTEAENFSTVFTTDTFFPAALSLDGGTGIVRDEANVAEGVRFTIRGTIK